MKEPGDTRLGSGALAVFLRTSESLKKKLGQSVGIWSWINDNQKWFTVKLMELTFQDHHLPPTGPCAQLCVHHLHWLSRPLETKPSPNAEHIQIPQWKRMVTEGKQNMGLARKSAEFTKYLNPEQCLHLQNRTTPITDLRKSTHDWWARKWKLGAVLAPGAGPVLISKVGKMPRMPKAESPRSNKMSTLSQNKH